MVNKDYHKCRDIPSQGTDNGQTNCPPTVVWRLYSLRQLLQRQV